MKKLLMILLIFTAFSSCHKSSNDNSPVIIRLENRTGKDIAAVTFFSVQSTSRSQFEYSNIHANGYSEYVVQTETNFSRLIAVQYTDGSKTEVAHPWWGNEAGRLTPDAGKYTYTLVALDGNYLNLIVQSKRD